MLKEKRKAPFHQISIFLFRGSKSSACCVIFSITPPSPRSLTEQMQTESKKNPFRFNGCLFFSFFSFYSKKDKRRPSTVVWTEAKFTLAVRTLRSVVDVLTEKESCMQYSFPCNFLVKMTETNRTYYSQVSFRQVYVC